MGTLSSRGLAIFFAAAALALSGCASAGSPSGSSAAAPSPTGVEVIGTGLVIDDGSGAQLCLGAAAMSDPPQCAGVPLVGWSWQGLTDATTSSGVTSGSYAVQGRYDGATLTLTTTPVLLALYDAAPVPEASPERGNADPDTVQRVREELGNELAGSILTMAPADGHVDLLVAWDDGSLQDDLDERYGPGVVRVMSALRPVE